MPLKLTSDLPFVELRRIRITSGAHLGRTRVVILREDGKTETLWPDEVEGRRRNQKLARQDMAARQTANPQENK
jgi:hypothetical protein